jgi:hypothetical protein
MNAICLVIDRLHAGYLGAWGNTWIETPSLDRLASQSLVFDQMLADTPELGPLYRSYWHGWHALCPPPPADRRSLPAMLREAGVASVLLADEPAIRQHPLAAEFDEVVPIDPPWQAQVAGRGQFEQTHLARCFLQIIDWLNSAPRPFLLWCHLASLGTIWDAPLEFRCRYLEEGDPPPPSSADVPDRLLDENPDPDDVWGVSQSYAGQVSLLDTCLGALDEFLRGSPLAADTLLALTSARGFPLGEHGRLGPCDQALYGELLHVPLLLRFPDNLGAAMRSQALVEPADLWATLLDYWQIGDPPRSPSGGSLMPLAREELPALRDRLCAIGRGSERAIRTPAWYLRRAAEPELFAKPADFWEVNNVASRCQEVVECLGDAIVEFEQVLHAGRVADLPALHEVLVEGLE